MRATATSIIAAAVMAAPLTVAGQSEPLQISNLSPLASLRALPRQRDAQPASGLSWAISGTVSSHFTVQSVSDESLLLDGQTDTLTLSLRYGLAPGWDIEATLPWRHHSGGFTDRLISDWHRVFGLPDGDRSDYPIDALNYELTQGGHQAALNQSVSGLGDIEIGVSRAIAEIDGGQLATSVGIKLATGDDSDWLGSGSTDVYALLRFSGPQRGDWPVWWHAQVGGTWAGETDLLGAQQRRSLWFAGLATEWRFSPRWSALAQFDAHSALLQGELDAVSQPAGMLSFALRWRPASHWMIDFGFSEDVVVEASPDITFLLNARWSPSREWVTSAGFN